MAPRSATEEMAALAMETSDATATEAVAAPEAPQGRSRALKLAGAAGAAALAAGSVAAVVTGRAAPFSSLLQQAVGGGVTALQQSRNFQIGVGCTNWDMLLLQEAALCTADDCWDLCAQTAGCKAMNFQGMMNELCGAGGGKEQGTCYLYAEGCEQTDNDCWTLGVMPATVTGGPGGSGGSSGPGGTGGALTPVTDITPATGGPGGSSGSGDPGGTGGALTPVTGGSGGPGSPGGPGGPGDLGGTSSPSGSGGPSGPDAAGGSPDAAGDKIEGASAGEAPASAGGSLEPQEDPSTTLADTVTGNLKFNSDGTKAEVEAAVRETLVDLLELEPSQVAVEAVAARRLSFGSEVMGPRRLFLSWIVTFTIKIFEAVPAAEIVDRLGAIVKKPTALLGKLGQKLPNLVPGSCSMGPIGEIPAFDAASAAPAQAPTPAVPTPAVPTPQAGPAPMAAPTPAVPTPALAFTTTMADNTFDETTV